MSQKIISQGAEAIITLITKTPTTKSKPSRSKKSSPLTTSSQSKSDNSLSPSGRAGGGKRRTSDLQNFIIKDRIKKSYRIPELDKKIRTRRTKAEAKLLTKASKIINCPIPFFKPDVSYKIKMPFIDGKKLSEHLDEFPLTKQKQILKQIGKDIAKLHNENIIHGDLTTSNMILLNHSQISTTKTPNSKISSLTNKRVDLIDSPFGRAGKGDGGGLIKSTSEPIIFFIDFGLGYFNGKYEDKAVDIHLLKQALEAKHFKNWKTLFKEFENGYKQKNTDAEKVFNQLIKVEKRGRYKH